MMHLQRPILKTALRFLVSGAFNTGVTLLLYWLLLHFLHYQWAYLASYCSGVLLSYLLNTRYVFRARHTWLRLATFPLIYLTVYALGALALRLSVGYLKVPEAFAPLLSIAVTLPVSFLLTRALLRPDRHPESR